MARIVLEPGRAERHYWRDLWRYRELFAILAWRDVAVRYKQTVIGVAWAVIRPFLTMVVFTVVFGRLAKLPSDGAAPYPLMVFAGMLPWFLFSTILSDASNSLVGNANLIGKVYFPRLIMPVGDRRWWRSSTSLINFVLLFALMAVVSASRRAGRSLLLPPFVALAVLASLGPGAVDHGAQRQIPRLPLHHPVHRAVRPLRLAGRVFQSPSCRTEWRLLYSLNPWSASSTASAGAARRRQRRSTWPGFLISLARRWRSSCGLGIAYFRRTERTFADLI